MWISRTAVKVYRRLDTITHVGLIYGFRAHDSHQGRINITKRTADTPISGWVSAHISVHQRQWTCRKWLHSFPIGERYLSGFMTGKRRPARFTLADIFRLNVNCGRRKYGTNLNSWLIELSNMILILWHRN